MQPAVGHHIFDRITLAVVAILVTAPITFLEVVHPSLQTLRDEAGAIGLHLPVPVTSSASVSKPVHHTAAKSPAAKPVTTPAAAATPVAAPAAAAPTAITNSFVHLRAAKSVSSQIITDLNGGTTVQLRDDSDATWQGVTYQGKNGYIYRAYLQYQPTAAAH